MEVSEVKRRVSEMMERARRAAAERRVRSDEAARAYEAFLQQTAIPVFRQVANVLKAQSYPFSVFTPSGSVRLISDRGAEDFVELSLDTSGDEPQVLGRVSRRRGGRVIEAERPVAGGAPQHLSDADVLSFLLKELEPFFER